MLPNLLVNVDTEESERPGAEKEYLQEGINSVELFHLVLHFFSETRTSKTS
jgi:hypothetical protein